MIPTGGAVRWRGQVARSETGHSSYSWAITNTPLLGSHEKVWQNAGPFCLHIGQRLATVF